MSISCNGFVLEFPMHDLASLLAWALHYQKSWLTLCKSAASSEIDQHIHCENESDFA